MDEKAVSFILQSLVVATYVARIAGKWPLTIATAELFGADSVTPMANDLFLCAALEAATLTSVQLEGLLGYARAELLRLCGEQGEYSGEADDDIVAFACALARQCFISGDPDETAAPLIMDHVGAGCFMWASDYPHPDHPGTWVDALTKLVQPLGEQTRGAFLGGNVRRIYGLGA